MGKTKTKNGNLFLASWQPNCNCLLCNCAALMRIINYNGYYSTAQPKPTPKQRRQRQNSKTLRRNYAHIVRTVCVYIRVSVSACHSFGLSVVAAAAAGVVVVLSAAELSGH